MKNRNPYLDLIRFVAANLVVLQHLVYIEWGSVGSLGKLRPYGDLGYLGVDVFFALSGYVISLSALGRNPKDFLIARFIRIFPGLLFAGLLAAICLRSPHAPVHTGLFGDLSSIFLLNSATGTQFSNPVFWTLAYEFKFYILVSLLLLMRKNSLSHLRIAASIWLFISFILGQTPTGTLGAIFIPDYAPCFILGMILSGIKNKRDFFQSAPLLAISLLLATNRRILEWKTFPSYRQVWHSQTLTGITLIVLLSFFAMSVFVTSKNLMFNKIAYRLGTYSYPIYLFHFTPMLTLLSILYLKTHHAIESVLISYTTMLAAAIFFAELIEPRLKRIFKSFMN
jgi:peptidoglycan/LPS O-acetylase OafA/YrhL